MKYTNQKLKSFYAILGSKEVIKTTTDVNVLAIADPLLFVNNKISDSYISVLNYFLKLTKRTKSLICHHVFVLNCPILQAMTK